MDNGRIMKELKELQAGMKTSTPENRVVEARVVGDNIRHWKGTIHGPGDTCYEGGTFIVDIEIPSDYPFKPPKMKFDTKMWHPNVSS